MKEQPAISAKPKRCTGAFAIAVVAYNRPKSLQRLLRSLSKADYSGCNCVTLIISLDKSDCEAVRKGARDFVWHFGEKKVIEHSRHLGLTSHIIFCGNLSLEYDSILVLEDDLIVSPGFYNYVCQAIDFYYNSDRIAGISLYSDLYNEYAQMRFIPIDDGYDNYFLQIAASWGQVWTQKQWSGFISWYESNVKETIDSDNKLPQFVMDWPDPNDWKKHYIRYLVAKDKYFVIPRSSLSTNCGEKGTHITVKHGNYHAYLLLQNKEFNFSFLEQSQAVYDCHYELEAAILKRSNNFLSSFDFECDFYGTKNLDTITCPYILTVRNCYNAIANFGSELVPQELNVAFDIEGDFFYLAEVKHCQSFSFNKRLAQYINLHQYAGIKRFMALGIYSLACKLKDAIAKLIE